MYDRILVAVDHSEISDRAVLAACDLAHDLRDVNCPEFLKAVARRG